MKSLGLLFVFLSDESGQDMIEYALMAAVIGLGAVLSIKKVGTVITTFFYNLAALESYI